MSLLTAVAVPFSCVLGVVPPRLSLHVHFLRNLAASMIAVALSMPLCPDYTDPRVTHPLRMSLKYGIGKLMS